MPSARRQRRRRHAAEHDRVLPRRVVRRPERAHGGVSVRHGAGVLRRDDVHRAGRGRKAGAPRGLHRRGRAEPSAATTMRAGMILYNYYYYYYY